MINIVRCDDAAGRLKIPSSLAGWVRARSPACRMNVAADVSAKARPNSPTSVDGRTTTILSYDNFS